MSAGYIQKRRGILDHLRDGRLTLLELGAHDVIILLADKATGMWVGSAKALSANCGAGDITDRQARHLLESLEIKGYIRRFPKRRSHANYPILVNRYLVTFGAYSGMTLNASATSDWRKPVYESRQEQGAEQGLEDGAEQGAERAPIQEVRSKKEKIEKSIEGAATKTVAPPPQIAAVISLPLNDGTEHPISEHQVNEWLHLYPAVDVVQALRSMRGWLLANRANRKTKNGIGKFIVAWLNRDQDKAVPVRPAPISYAERDRLQRQADANPGGGNRQPRKLSPEEEADLRLAEIEDERWQQLEKGTLPVTTDTIEWIRVKQERLKKVPKLPAQDPRPRLFTDFLRRAGQLQQVSL